MVGIHDALALRVNPQAFTESLFKTEWTAFREQSQVYKFLSLHLQMRLDTLLLSISEPSLSHEELRVRQGQITEVKLFLNLLGSSSASAEFRAVEKSITQNP